MQDERGRADRARQSEQHSRDDVTHVMYPEPDARHRDERRQRQEDGGERRMGERNRSAHGARGSGVT